MPVTECHSTAQLPAKSSFHYLMVAEEADWWTMITESILSHINNKFHILRNVNNTHLDDEE